MPKALDAAIAAAELVETEAETKIEIAASMCEAATERLDEASVIAASAVEVAAQAVISARLDSFEGQQAERWHENQTVHGELRTAIMEIRTEIATLSRPLTPLPSQPQLTAPVALAMDQASPESQTPPSKSGAAASPEPSEKPRRNKVTFL
jgi:hypothetical protein